MRTYSTTGVLAALLALSPAQAADSVSLASPDNAVQLRIDSYGGASVWVTR